MIWRRRKKENAAFYDFFKNILGFTPRRTEVYQTALIHRSMSVETAPGRRINNERLEYLGDAVLSAIVAEFLYRKYPTQGEGFLTELRSKIVSRSNLNQVAQKIGLSQLIQYNKDSQGLFKSIGGDAFEALVGALYIEKGYRFTRRVIIDRILHIYIDVEELSHKDWNFKSKLIDWGQKKRQKVSFEVVRVIYQGKKDANRRKYEIRALINGEPYESAIEYSIKGAEQLAAEKTYKKLIELGKIKTSTSTGA